jgi:hypothetical protein
MTNTIYVVYGGRDNNGVLYVYKTRFSTFHEYYAWIKLNEESKESAFWHNRVNKKVWQQKSGDILCLKLQDQLLSSSGWLM